ncbi:MAG: radical SAM protein [Candidatus Sericytochromatia bacterium]
MPSTAAAPVIVGLVEITEPTSFLHYLPYASGLLQAYALAHAVDPQRYGFLPPQFLRKPVAEMVELLLPTQVAGFSVYTWNVNYNLAIAKALKRAKPETLIVFGGPQVPDEPNAFLSYLPFIDVVVHGEGEATFLRLLEAWPGNQWENIPGISYRGTDGAVITHPKPARIKDLDLIPSAYLSGIYEPLIAQHPDIRWAAVWETNRGCPFSCTFCDWGSAIASKVYRFGIERLEQELEWFGRNKIGFLFCADANYGILPRDLEIARRMVAVNQALGNPKRIITQMTKNSTERAFEAHKILSDAGLLVAATLSLQSVTPSVLEAIKRDNISLEVYHQLLQRFVANGIPTYTDVLLGLPGETFDSFLDVLDTVISQGQHTELRIWNVHLLPNAEMSAPAYRKKYGIEAVVASCHAPYDKASGYQTGIQEECEMVIATHTMSRQDWLRMQALAWMVQIYYYGRLLQLPLLLIHELTGLSHRDLLLAFLEDPLPPDTPIQGFIRQFLLNKAWEVSQGQTAYCETSDPETGLAAWVTPAAYTISQLHLSGQLGAFYLECGKVLDALLSRKGLELPPHLLEESLRLLRFSFEGGFDMVHNSGVELSYNLLECYAQILKGQPFQLKYLGRAQMHYLNPLKMPPVI